MVFNLTCSVFMLVLGCASGLLNVFIKLSEHVLEALRTRSESFMNKLFIYRWLQCCFGCFVIYLTIKNKATGDCIIGCQGM